MSRYRSLRRNHDFSVLWIGQTVSELGTTVSMFVFPLIGFAITGSTLLAGLVEAVHLGGQAAALLPAGVLADRVDRRLLMRTASGVGALLHLSLVVAALTGAITLPHLLVVALLTGAAAGVFSPSELSSVRTIVPTEDLPAALSQNQARRHVASLVGAPLGGLLYGLTRWLPFAADAASYAVSWMLLGRLRADLAPATDGPRRTARADLREGASFVTHHPLFRTLTVWSCLTNLTMNALFTAAILRMVSEGVDPFHIGLVETVAGAAGITGAMIAPWLIDRVPTGWLTIAIAWSPLPLVVPMAVWGDPAVVAAAVGCVLLLNPAGNAGMSSYRMAVTPPALVGRVQSAIQFVAMASLPLAPVLAGVLLSQLGGATAVLVTGVLGGAVALIPTLARCVRTVPRPSQWVAPRTTGPSEPATV